MKRLLGVIALSVLSGVCSADELADGIKAWEMQEFAQARQVFGKLAEAGNPEAQLLLGEMYGFGEGVPEDMERARHWLTQAQARGHKDAAASIATFQQRAARKAEIAYYVSGYDGADVSLARFGCVKPAIPAISKSRAEIKAVAATVQQWTACYERFAANLAAALPAGKAIPAGLATLMSMPELARARRAMDPVIARAASDGERQAREVIAANDAWVARTRDFSVQFAKLQVDESDRRRRELEETQERVRNYQRNKEAGLVD